MGREERGGATGRDGEAEGNGGEGAPKVTYLHDASACRRTEVTQTLTLATFRN
jgi:hypothetical protein